MSEILEVKEGYCIEFLNRDSCMGYNYPEDTWSIWGIGETVEAAIEDAVPTAIRKGLDPSSAYLSKCRYTTFEGRNVILDDKDSLGCEASGSSLIKMLEESPAYIAFKSAERKRKEDEAALAKKRQEEFTMRQEINQLAALLEKHPEAAREVLKNQASS